MKHLMALVASLTLTTALASAAGADTQKEASTGQVTKGPWLGYIYIDLDGAAGADRAIKLLPNQTWELLEPSGAPGLYDRKLASGRLAADGTLDNLPATAFDRAKVIWQAGTVTTLIAGKQIASPRQLCNVAFKAKFSAGYVVPTENDWLQYCSNQLSANL